MLVGGGACSSRNHHFVAQILAYDLNLVDQLLGSGVLIRVAPLVPPFLQDFALRELLLKDFVCLLKCIPKVGDADIQDSIRRQQGKDFAFITRTRSLDFRQFRAKF